MATPIPSSSRPWLTLAGALAVAAATLIFAGCEGDSVRDDDDFDDGYSRDAESDEGPSDDDRSEVPESSDGGFRSETTDDEGFRSSDDGFRSDEPAEEPSSVGDPTEGFPTEKTPERN